ncbi:MAG TPA: long-chain fatty acid--CoA ligase [Polyangiaceae bacterium]|nr:long-chain fatty acid--CoA ligase [Polyangiaceae bacterium]
MLNLAVIAREGAKRFGEKPALLGAHNYRELDTAARRVAGALRARGMERGTHVALMLPNVPSFATAYYGCHYAGLPVVPLNVMLKTDEIAYHLEDSDAAALVVHESLVEQARAACGKSQMIVAGDRLDMDAPPVDELPDTRADDTAVLLYTSGTTGRPKGAELTHFNLFQNAEVAARVHGTTEDTVALAVLPLFHSFGQTVIMNGTLLRGGSVVMLPRFEPLAALETIERQRVTFFAGVPTMYFALLHHPEAARFDLTSLRECVSGGAPMPVEVMRAFDARYGVDILEGYGLSETSPVASVNPRPKKPGSIGMPIWGVEFRLVDESGRTIENAGTPGEILIKGHNIMKGYYKRADATREALVDGWLRTGDIAVRDDDGYYFIVDRKKDLILRGGFNVYPREVEEVLYAHPAVGEAAVIGVADERLGEEVKAVVALKPGAEATPDELVAWCRERMAAYKHPRTVELVAALPKGPTGKILKRALR